MADIPAGEDSFISWIHFGDLHITERAEENYEDFLALIDEVNENLTGDIDFALLPGDNADDGTIKQFELVREALEKLNVTMHVITGDHDCASGSLEAFRQVLEPELYRARTLHGFRLLFLNALDGKGKPGFGVSGEQAQWVEGQLADAKATGLRPIVFTHLYPTELLSNGTQLSHWIEHYGVEFVEMGHTHYNELANDGHTIYAATRSTGQIEEGAPGFSFTAIDGDVVSWKFKERGVWPLVLITSPAEHLLITRPKSPRHVVRDAVNVRAKIWGANPIESVICRVDGLGSFPMENSHGHWQFTLDTQTIAYGVHSLVVEATTCDGRRASDEISILVSQSGQYTARSRSTIDYENGIGSYPGKGILGTQLGPNKNGTKGPWPSWRRDRP